MLRAEGDRPPAWLRKVAIERGLSLDPVRLKSGYFLGWKITGKCPLCVAAEEDCPSKIRPEIRRGAATILAGSFAYRCEGADCPAGPNRTGTTPKGKPKGLPPQEWVELLDLERPPPRWDGPAVPTDSAEAARGPLALANAEPQPLAPLMLTRTSWGHGLGDLRPREVTSTFEAIVQWLAAGPTETGSGAGPRRWAPVSFTGEPSLWTFEGAGAVVQEIPADTSRQRVAESLGAAAWASYPAGDRRYLVVPLDRTATLSEYLAASSRLRKVLDGLGAQALTGGIAAGLYYPGCPLTGSADWSNVSGKALSVDRLLEAASAGASSGGLADSLDHTAPTLSSLYDPGQLQQDRDRRLLPIDSLPLQWPHGPKTGHGWGAVMNAQLGGGLCPGSLLALGASAAGGGKTAFLMQLADGLAIRSAMQIIEGGDGPLTSMLFVSEMDAGVLSARSFGRWAGVPFRLFRAGGDAASWLASAGMAQDAAAAQRELVDPAYRTVGGLLKGPAGYARTLCRVWKSPARGTRLVEEIARCVATWSKALAAATGREVWPVVVFDPLQRWTDSKRTEVEGLNELIETIEATAQQEGWIVFLTSDTTKSAAVGAKYGTGTVEEAVGAFRGSYKLMHAVDVAMYLRRWDEQSGGRAQKMEIVFAKNRFGTSSLENPMYCYDTTCGRFTPMSAEQIGWAVVERKAEEKDRGAPRNGTPRDVADDLRGLVT